MEVVIPKPPMDFNFDSACTSPHISAPSSPNRFGNVYFSAPSSPARASAIYNDFRNLSFNNGSISSRGASSSVIPFDWEEKPGRPKSKDSHEDDDDDGDFEFSFGGKSDIAPLTADELFDGGKIKPLKPPPGLQLGSRLYDESATRKNHVSSPRSPRSPIAQGKKMFRDAFSPRQRKEVDPFAVAIEQSRKGADQVRGRERVSVASSSNSNRRATRSLSPFRVSEFAWEEQRLQQQQEQQEQQQQQQQHISKPTSASSSSSSLSSSFMGYRKWKLKDFLLFRSASEGRATDKDPLGKFAVLSKKAEDLKNSSFQSTNSNGSTGSRRRESISPHELHYKVNRAVAVELKKKTFLPYKQGLLGVFGLQSSRPKTR